MASAVLQPHQERVITEREDLHGKIERLRAFIYREKFDSIAAEERSRLLKQLAVMKLYREILDERIAAF
jgi:hypothetical protein